MVERLHYFYFSGKYLLSYTFPVQKYGLDFPFVDVIKYGHWYLDSISLMGLNSNKTIQSVLDLGIPPSKAEYESLTNFFSALALTLSLKNLVHMHSCTNFCHEKLVH